MTNTTTRTETRTDVRAQAPACMTGTDLCRKGAACEHAVAEQHHHLNIYRWYITMGHPGFNSVRNNVGGYDTEAAARGVIRTFAARGKALAAAANEAAAKARDDAKFNGVGMVHPDGSWVNPLSAKLDREARIRTAKADRDARELDRVRPVIGATIADVRLESFGDETITVIIIRTKDGIETTIAALRDAEGNGPGYIDVDPAGKLGS